MMLSELFRDIPHTLLSGGPDTEITDQIGRAHV